MAETITRPKPEAPAAADALEALFGDHHPDVLDAKFAAWVQSPQPWKKLTGVHPELRIKVWRIIMAMGVLGFRVMVASGVRTDAEQQADYKKGRRNVPGEAIVTHLDGVTRRSNHQLAQPPSRFAGYATAVDFCFVGDDLKPSWAEQWPWAALGAVAKAQGCVWGGDWPTLRDRPHVELFR